MLNYVEHGNNFIASGKNLLVIPPALAFKIVSVVLYTSKYARCWRISIVTSNSEADHVWVWLNRYRLFSVETKIVCFSTV